MKFPNQNYLYIFMLVGTTLYSVGKIKERKFIFSFTQKNPSYFHKKILYEMNTYIHHRRTYTY